jgi:hypothetical protein
MIELDPASTAGERYLLLADISGYTAFMTSVEQGHGVDFSQGIPAGFAVLGALLDTVIEGVQPAFAVAKLEGRRRRTASRRDSGIGPTCF